MAYNALDRTLHRLALGSVSVAEMSFDIDQRLSRGDPAGIAGGAHVFVCGFARAGTTILMRRLHATGAFRSLAYADMPFVLAPTLWGRISGGRANPGPAVERAHGDGILVDANSPEGLEEVFWRVFAGERYISARDLRPHQPDKALIDRFQRYVAAILGDQGTRYLSKNNNNVLRLPAISQAFPKAAILVPFRAPLAHAQSLLRQHRRFTERHQVDRFSRNYMTWLGHHEFGSDHRPFRLSAEVVHPEASDTLDYWLERWIEIYGWLLETAPPACTFICYEDLCADPRAWARLCETLHLDDTGDEPDFVNRSAMMPATCTPGACLDRAEQIYDKLRSRALRS
ncbi:MAG: sulfotransferase [Pseudomonadota bacterium]